MNNRQPVYGLLAEFYSAEELLEATKRTSEAGYRKVDAFSPFPIEGLAEAIGFHRTKLPIIVFCGGLMGTCGGFFLQWWPNVIGYPLNIGGKPWDSWPAFIPITFELTILCAALSATFGMLALNGLPSPYHPVFNAERFAQVTRDRFFLVIESEDPKFDLQLTRQFLTELNAREVSEVES
jgi:Alternative complex III, ActD subunit